MISCTSCFFNPPHGLCNFLNFRDKLIDIKACNKRQCKETHFTGPCIGAREGANKQVISSQADSLIKISRIWADFFPANTSNQPI